ncbi:D-glycero-beta-D-manno-heptose 1-phosphate adenylyltransferase [Bombella saccharophila]|uniref:Bifunctional protein HldE n=1 Tax=Bombella saccharophila TaxID=2967338 RepID=A0ABT3W804_9PROT|nr:D-glycero-beta-D-manno-heptose 1-phosphate adenylyltransferase [Bombella saccharophila]MCX5613907.1 D-glycero-beta-D-manno-heptose 1-phosphate adenylyltransferase [Bombella saccharophila]
MSKPIPSRTITILGDLLLDQYISGEVNRISPEAPVPVLLHTQERVTPGGAANVAVNAAALGHPVHLIGVVGKDPAAETLRQALAQWSDITLTGLITDPHWTTITKTRVLSGRQQIVRLDQEKLTPFPRAIEDALIAATLTALETSRILICSDYAKGVLSDYVLQNVIAAARARDIPILVDPKRADISAYRGASLLTPNRQELRTALKTASIHPLTGHEWALDNDAEIEQACTAIAPLTGSDILLTRSEKGMTLWQQEAAPLHCQAHPSEVYDVSGAGDTVIATIACALADGHALPSAVTMATTAAAIAVSKLGTAYVTHEELRQHLLAEIADNGSYLPLADACAIVETWKRHGASVVFTNGCFDLLHPGHVALVQYAAGQGDKLIVALNSDASIKRLKGPRRPLQHEQARATVIRALRHVDLVVLFDEDTPLETITALKPDIIVKGADYKEDEVVGGDFIKAYGGRVCLAPLLDGHSTSHIVKTMDDTHPLKDVP